MLLCRAASLTSWMVPAFINEGGNEFMPSVVPHEVLW